MSMPHENSPVLAAGATLGEARAAMILIHGRGASAQDILTLVPYLDFPDMAYLAPQAEGFTWYPNRFIVPVEHNEPHLSAALSKVDGLVRHVEAGGVPIEKIFIGGFSQGACLASEYVIRNPRPYGGLLAFSGGYIGPIGPLREAAGRLDGVPALLGCSDVDPHIPLQRVNETTALLRAMGADVIERIYPGMDHTINEEELELARKLIENRL